MMVQEGLSQEVTHVTGARLPDSGCAIEGGFTNLNEWKPG